MQDIQPSNTPSLAVFSDFPSQLVINEFKEHLRKTGTPETWRFHSHSKALVAVAFEELCKFEIPDNFRKSIGRATCPLCSPNNPKYFEGRLAWFPEEKVVRAIGHECAKTYVGDIQATEARRNREHRERIRYAEDFLIANLPKASQKFELLSGLNLQARQLDTVRRNIWRFGSKRGCLDLVKLAKEGYFPIFERQNEHRQDKHGNLTEVEVEREVKRVPVSGINFLKSNKSIESFCVNALTALEPYSDIETDETALEYVIELAEYENNLLESKTKLEGAFSLMNQFNERFAEAKVFLNSQNLKSIAEWSNDSRVKAPIILRYDLRRPFILNIGKIDGPRLLGNPVALPQKTSV